MSPELTNGPYFRFPNQTYSKYVLTKSHCGGTFFFKKKLIVVDYDVKMGGFVCLDESHNSH